MSKFIQAMRGLLAVKHHNSHAEQLCWRSTSKRLMFVLGRLPKAIQQEISEYFSDREFALASMANLLNLDPQIPKQPKHS